MILSIILLASAGMISAASRMIPGFAQWYSETVYPLLQGTLGRLAGLFPFSAAEWLCVLLPAFLLIHFMCTCRKDAAKRILSVIILIVSVLFFMYTVNCGINYYRNPFVDSEAFARARFTEDELVDFCECTADQLAGMSVSGDSTDFAYPDWDELSAESVRAMSSLSSLSEPSFNDYRSLSGFYPQPKKMAWISRLFSMMGVSGIYSPFTIEANVNGEMVGLEMPFTACHELSHLKGFMNEGEANYIGWLACINSDNAAFNRSGWIMAWIYAGNSLHAIDPEKYLSIKEKLPDDVIRELRENSEFWKKHENKASEVQDRVNDAYLKSHGQEHGIHTYSQLTTLMLMWYSAK